MIAKVKIELKVVGSYLLSSGKQYWDSICKFSTTNKP